MDCIKNILVEPCMCERHKPKPYRELSMIILDCWQRDYGRRPYDVFILHGKIFEQSMYRLVDDNDFEIIIQFIKERKLLTVEFTYIPITAIQSVNLMNCLQSIPYISLAHVDMPLDGMKILAENASQFRVISLRLTGNIFTREHAENLRIFLLNNKTLIHLDVGFCDFDHTQFAIVADGIINCLQLKAVDMSRLITINPFNIVEESKISMIIAIILNRLKLQEAHFKHCFLDQHDMIPIAEYLQLPIELVYLDLGSNKIGADGAITIFKALKHTPHLIGLDISNNNIGHCGGESIAHLLPYTYLRYLDIARNKITANTMELILKTIKKPHHIRILNIAGNDFNYAVGRVLHRQTEAYVLLLQSIDVCVTYDVDFDGFRIVPRYNDNAEYNYRYHRATPLYRINDNTPNLQWHTKYQCHLLVNGLFIDPIFLDKNSRVFRINYFGDIVEPEIHKIYNFD